MSLAATRMAAMAVSLLALTLTYRVLTPQDFSLFNVVLFLIALGSAVSQPLNRVFWASDSDLNYPLSGAASLFIGAMFVLVGVTISLLLRNYPLPFSMAAAAVSAAYAAARVVERYGYGRLLVAGWGRAAVLPILLFALSDLTAVAVMWAGDSDDFIARMIFPPVAFLLIVWAVDQRKLAPRLLAPAESLRALLRFMREHLFSAVGSKVLVMGTVMTLAGMADRATLNFLSPASPTFEASYLLALSYAIALQTLMSFMFDLARTHVYRDHNWQDGARRCSMYIVAITLGMTFAAALSYPVLITVGLLSPTVGWLVWLALLARVLALTLVTMLNVDRFQEGRVSAIVWSGLIVLAATLASQLIWTVSGSLNHAAIVLIAVNGGVIAVVAHKFFARIPGA
jgi:hypothetical protein